MESAQRKADHEREQDCQGHDDDVSVGQRFLVGFFDLL
jgi:hypothetical protein